MELRQLRHFMAVVEHGHFTRAAESVHLSQSALSASVRALENELGTALFERTTRSVIPTDAGTVLYPYAQRMLGEAQDAVAAVGRVRTGELGTLALGTVQTFTAVDLPALLAHLHGRYPGIGVTLKEATTDELFDAGGTGNVGCIRPAAVRAGRSSSPAARAGHRIPRPRRRRRRCWAR